MEPVELTADDLLLRAWRPEDADAVYRACQDPLIQRWTMVGSPYSLDDAKQWVEEASARRWTEETAAPFGIFDARTGELLGSHGLVRLDMQRRTGEAGLWIAPWARNRGVGVRSTRAVALWALDVLGLRRLTWQVIVGNHASRLIAERVGFVFGGVQKASLHSPDGRLVDGWRGVLLPGRIRREPPAWVAPGAPGARRAAAFGRPQPRLAVPKDGLTLRPIDHRDVHDIVTTSRDAETIRWTSVPVPYEIADAAWFVDVWCLERWAAGTVAAFAIADAEDRYCGVVDVRLDQGDPMVAEVGIVLAPWARGRGYATAAARTVCGWAFEALALDRLVWRAHVGNDTSRRVAERVGFVAEGVQRHGCDQRGERRDAWVGALLSTDLDG